MVLQIFNNISIILMCVFFLVFLEFLTLGLPLPDNSNFVFIITEGITPFLNKSILLWLSIS